ncbi:MAG: CRTAC1 family protein, partial [Acidobacteriota bacterium]
MSLEDLSDTSPHLLRSNRAGVLLAAAVFGSVGGSLGVPLGASLGASLGSGAAQAPARGLFTDATEESGLDFVHFNGMTGALYMVENMGGGGALFDYDGDGDLDLYLVQGASFDDGRPPLVPPPHGPPLTDRLYRNDLETLPDGRLRARFVDVTAEAGIPSGGYGMGAAAGDYDGDGHVDLYVTNWGPNRLLRNRGDGTFEDATRHAGAGDDRWSVPAVFFDMDRDGDLDLFVGNYLEFTLAGHKPCLNPSGGRDYCSPAAYDAVPDRLLRNRGDGTFEDATADAGLEATPGKALGAVAADLDGDALPDLYVANDQTPNHLWRNDPERPGAFTDEALLAGCAVNGQGEAEAGMGVVAEDLDGDGDLDLFVTHLDGETSTLYENRGGGLFADATPGSGLGGPSLAVTGFGVAPLDADGDGRLDLLVADGAVRTLPDRAAAGDPYPLAQRDQLFLNRSEPGAFRFVHERGGLGSASRHLGVGRAVLAGDLDEDGDTDVVVVDSAGPARLLRSRLHDGPVGEAGGWIGVSPVNALGRPVSGAEVRLVRPDGGTTLRRAARDGSYAASSDPRVRFALGEGGADSGSVREVAVRWPDGGVTAWR